MSGFTLTKCAICRNELTEECITCMAGGFDVGNDNEADPQTGGGECQVTTLECTHSFHAHCLSAWCKSRDSCPLDNLAPKIWKRTPINSFDMKAVEAEFMKRYVKK